MKSLCMYNINCILPILPTYRMKFCSQCDNMYYISLDVPGSSSSSESDQLLYYCRNCDKKEKMTSLDNTCVYTTQIKSTKQQFHHIINKYTKYDPTLPRVDTIPCPNDACSSKKSNPEVIYIRYDDEKQFSVYICTECDTVWRTDRFGDINEV